VGAGSRLAGHTLQEASADDSRGALVLALRGLDGTFVTNPSTQTPIEAGAILIAIGTEPQLRELRGAAGQRRR
jgi:voltage-gated potassium channel